MPTRVPCLAMRAGERCAIWQLRSSRSPKYVLSTYPYSPVLLRRVPMPISDTLVLVVAMVREMSNPYALSHVEPNCCSVYRRAEHEFILSARRVHRL